MLRTDTCGELRITDVGKKVILCGWVQKNRDLGGMTFIDLRDRYGITQIVFNMVTDADLCKKACTLGREYVISVEGDVAERSNKSKQLPTGEIEIIATDFTILNPSLTPPFTIEESSDGGDDIRMQYRYLDLRRKPLQRNLMIRHKLGLETRKYLSECAFIEIETPFLIKSTPEGARDFIVPSRMNEGTFYALPQSPQTFKQLLMVSGFDRYFQIVKCFRDEDLRADRQPEFTQIDCEMSFVEQSDVLEVFEGLIRHLLKEILSVTIPRMEIMKYSDAMNQYGSDKPDTRFEIKFQYLDDMAKGKGFKVFDEAEKIIGIVAPGCAVYSRKQLDKLSDWVKRPQIGAKGLIYVRCNEDGSFKSSVDNFYTQEDLAHWCKQTSVSAGDLLLLLSGEEKSTQKQLGELRLHIADELELRDPKIFSALWVVDFPMFEWNEEAHRFQAMHHPFTAPKNDDLSLLDSDPGAVRANAYDMVINGVEVGGGSLRIHNRQLQEKVFEKLGFTQEKAKEQFGFLMSAFEYGAPPHGGIAFGFDRLCALFGGNDSIRDYIAFPKNNSGKDVMIDAPSIIDEEQLQELHLSIEKKQNQ